MSAMDPMYGIPAVIRYGISLFNCWESKELVEAGLQDYRERLNEYGDELMPEYVAKNMDYILSSLQGSICLLYYLIRKDRYSRR